MSRTFQGPLARLRWNEQGPPSPSSPQSPPAARPTGVSSVEPYPQRLSHFSVSCPTPFIPQSAPPRTHHPPSAEENKEQRAEAVAAAVAVPVARRPLPAARCPPPTAPPAWPGPLGRLTRSRARSPVRSLAGQPAMIVNGSRPKLSRLPHGSHPPTPHTISVVEPESSDV